MLGFPSGRCGETTGVSPESLSGTWDTEGLASRTSPVDVQDTVVFLSGIFSKSDKFGVTNTSGNFVLLWGDTGER